MFDLIKLLQQGGYVMLPLLLVSIVAVAVILERVGYYLRLQRADDAFRAHLLECVANGRQTEALAWLRTLQGPAPAVALAALEAWEGSAEQVEASMAARARREAAALRKGLAILDTAYSGSPLIGLLGTITGMMGTFRTVALHLAHEPSSDTSGVTAGIGEALVATATGITIAVTCLVFYSIFQNLADAHIDGAEALGADLLALHAARPQARTTSTQHKAGVAS